MGSHHEKKSKKPYILWFDEIGIEDVGLVGKKNASLGEMYQHLKKQKVQVPDGFAITSHSYRYVLEKKGAFDQLKASLDGLDPFMKSENLLWR